MKEHDSKSNPENDQIVNTDDALEPEEEIVFEEENTSNAFGDKKEKQLREKLKQAINEKQEYLAGWQRAKADLVNTKKDFEASNQRSIKRAQEDLIAELLPVLDSFTMAFANQEAWEKVDKNWRLGVEYIYNQFKKVLDEHGLVTVGEVGQMFDPEIHNSVELISVKDKKQDGKVMEVIQLGYQLNSKTIRPARVKVGEYSEQES